MSDPAWPQAVLAFWFDEIGPGSWWSHSPQVDAECAKRFGALHSALRDESASAFIDGGDRALAAVLLFDQFSRNLFRDSAAAFATDALARSIADAAIDRGYDRALPDDRRQFLYMPFMHSEDMGDQKRSLELFATLDDEKPLEFAREHYDLIARFGRFPHRNAVLGRETREEEKEAVEEGADW